MKKVVSLLSILLVIPAIIAAGIFLWNDRKYYLVSLLIIVASIIPLMLSYENRKPKAREIVVLAVMVAIGVAGRAAFYMLPQFKPVVAITIITAVAFGSEAGFVTGSMIAFVSNFIFGQGPWTPWQMFAFGITGFLAGVIFYDKKGTPPNILLLCVFGGLSTLILCGVVLDVGSLFMFNVSITWQSLLAILASGVVFNIIHGTATVFFLALLAKPLLKKLNRVKVKYGLLVNT